jgi:hypothetical protein
MDRHTAAVRTRLTQAHHRAIDATHHATFCTSPLCFCVDSMCWSSSSTAASGCTSPEHCRPDRQLGRPMGPQPRHAPQQRPDSSTFLAATATAIHDRLQRRIRCVRMMLKDSASSNSAAGTRPMPSANAWSEHGAAKSWIGFSPSTPDSYSRYPTVTQPIDNQQPAARSPQARSTRHCRMRSTSTSPAAAEAIPSSAAPSTNTTRPPDSELGYRAGTVGHTAQPARHLRH